MQAKAFTAKEPDLMLPLLLHRHTMKLIQTNVDSKQILKLLIKQLFEDKRCNDGQLPFEEANSNQINLGASNDATLNQNPDIIRYIGK